MVFPSSNAWNLFHSVIPSSCRILVFSLYLVIRLLLYCQLHPKFTHKEVLVGVNVSSSFQSDV